MERAGWAIRPVAALAVLALLASLASASSARAQDVGAAAQRFATGAIIGGGEMSGYRLSESGTAPDGRTVGALGSALVRFVPEPRGSRPVAEVLALVYVFPNAAAARQMAESMRRTPHCPYVRCTANNEYTAQGADAVMGFYGLTRDVAGNSDVSFGAGVQRANIYWEVYVFASERLQGWGAISGPAAEREMLRIAALQDTRVLRAGPFVPPSPSTPPESPPPVTPARPDMILLVTARVGGAMVREGTPIRALINGKECGSNTAVFGFTVISVSSEDSVAGCGTEGAPIRFRVGEDEAAETIVWNLNSFVTPVALSVARAVVGGGLLVRPTVEVNCVPLGEVCSPAERALWSANLEVWIADLQQRGIEPTGENLLRAWLEFRAGRGEVFAKLALAYLDAQPFTFISAVRHTPSATEPVPYVSLFNFGAARPVGGWQVRTGTGAVYTFPEGTVLPTGTCRIFAAPLPEGVEGGGVCPGAVFQGTGEALGSRGYVAITDAEGQIIDSVAW